MNPDGFDEYRSETLWPEIADHLDESPTSPGPGNKGIETVVDYLKMIVDDIPEEVAHWCESHSDARHIFTRYYPYSQQPVTFLLSNPRLDYNWDNPDKQIEHIEDDFPTLEHRRYAVTNQNDVRTLSQISAEHYNGYLYNDKGVECLLKRLGTVTETLNLSKVVRSLPEEDQWNRKRDEKNSGINSNDEGWKTYFYNPDTTRSTSLEDITETNPPKPTEVLEKLEGVTGKDRGLSAQSPDLDSGLFSDIYISNVYKLGSKGYPGPTNEDDHIRFTVQELRKAGSKLLIASGKPAQKVLFNLGEPIYDPKKEAIEDAKPDELLTDSTDYYDPTNSDAEAKAQNYGVVWKLGSDGYGLAVPHTRSFNGFLGTTFNGDLYEDLKASDVGWIVLSDALSWLGERMVL